MASRTISTCIRHGAYSRTSKAFVALASRGTASIAPPLDFLLPCRASYATSSLRPLSRQAPRKSASQIRSFSASTTLEDTRCIYNPKRDEEGEFMNIEITPRAANRLNTIATKDANPNLGLRITVESGGCHGFQYLMSLCNLPPIDPSTSQVADTPPLPPDAKEADIPKLDLEEDSVFTYFGEDGKPTARVVMDEPSLELLKGSKVDYTMELIGSQFKITGNPRASSSCGCGTSFDVKF